MKSTPDIATERVLLLMPSRTDSERTAELLAEAHIGSHICADLSSACRELKAGAGALIITDHALLNDSSGQLAEAMRAQPAWSAVPVLVIARDDARMRLERHPESNALRNLAVVARPVHMRTLLSMVLSALRERHQQYQIRDALLERERQASALIAQEEKLRFTLFAGGLGSWELDLVTSELFCSSLCKTHLGRPSDGPLSYREFQDSLHPDDKHDVLAAIAHSIVHRADYNVEFRVCSASTEPRWVMMRGRVANDGTAAAARMVGVTLDITERKRMHDALRQTESELALQAEQLRNADRLKDDFLATLAHELRNPLAPIRTGLEVLARASDPEVASNTIGVMQRQLVHMVRLVDDLLDVSRITRGKLDLKLERVALASVIDAAVEASRPIIAHGNHTLNLTVIPRNVSLRADFTRIAQVISNLLNNASKYTPPGGVISLIARSEGDQAVIDVSDNGIGIPNGRLEDVFAMFSQVSRAFDQTQGGLGIGLALVRRLVEMHQGTVKATSAGVGLGSTFTVRLPLAKAGDRTSVVPQLDAHVPSRATKRILIVDDNDDAADLLSVMLNQSGHVTTTAHDGPSALSTAEAWSPQVVILDIGLPGMSGYDVARRLRMNPNFQNTGLVALTGWGTETDKTKAAEAGFDAHLTKPVNAETLRSVLEQLHHKRA